MATIIKLLALVLFLGLIAKGYGQWSLDDIVVAQSNTGAVIQGKTEWGVVISNNCLCPQSELKLNCDGFQTVESVDPSILSVSGAQCLVFNGQPTARSSIVNFKYAWDTQFPLNPISSLFDCS